jgi:hypothetical protein
MHPNSATTIAEVTATGPVNGLRGLGTFRPDPSYGALSTFRPDPSYGPLATFRPDQSYGPLSGAPVALRTKNRFPYGMGGLGEYDGSSVGPVLIGVAVIGVGLGLFVWFWSSIFKLAKDKL